MTKKASVAPLRLGWLLALATAAAPRLVAQNPNLPTGVIPTLDAAAVQSLRAALRQGRWGQAQRIYFGSWDSGGTFRADLPDAIVYVARDTITQSLALHGAADTARTLWGQRYIYLLLFVEPNAILGRQEGGAPCGPPSGRGTLTAEVGRTNVNYQTDPFLVRLVSGFAQKFLGGAAPELKTEAVRDTSVTVSLEDVADSAAGAPLCGGFAKIPLSTNIDARISVQPAGWKFPGARRTVLNFLNASSSRFGLSVGVTATFGRMEKLAVDTLGHARTTDTTGTTITTRDSVITRSAIRSTGAGVQGNVHVLVHFAILRAALPRYPRSWDLVVGTNVARGDLLSELVTGLAVTRISGDVGLVGGCNWLESDTADGPRVRRCHGFVGLDLHF